MLTTPEEYLATLESPGREWLAEFLEYMKMNHDTLLPVMFRQRPMYKVGKSYVYFTVAKEHFSVHTLNFDLVEALRETLPRAGFGRGCIKVKFGDEAAKPVLRALCDEVVRLNQLETPPEVDVVPELPYEEALAKALPGVRAKWIPLYKKLRDAAKERLPEFTEFFPAVGVIWKHETTFASVNAVSGALRVIFYADREYPERTVMKTLQSSVNRVQHTAEARNEEDFADLLDWLAESYMLTKK